MSHGRHPAGRGRTTGLENAKSSNWKNSCWSTVHATLAHDAPGSPCIDPRSVSVISPVALMASMSASGLISPASRTPKLSMYHLRDWSASRQLMATWNTRMVSSDGVLNGPPSLVVDRCAAGGSARRVDPFDELLAVVLVDRHLTPADGWHRGDVAAVHRTGLHVGRPGE